MKGKLFLVCRFERRRLVITGCRRIIDADGVERKTGEQEEAAIVAQCQDKYAGQYDPFVLYSEWHPDMEGAAR